MNIKIGDQLFLSNGEESFILRAVPLSNGRTHADNIRSMSDEGLMNFLISVFCDGMWAEERGDDFLHSFPWTLDRLRQHVEEERSCQ